MVETTLRKAIERGLLVRIIYDSNGEYTERTIKPNSIGEQGVAAYCYLRKSKRIFKMSNILSAIIMETDL